MTVEVLSEDMLVIDAGTQQRPVRQFLVDEYAEIIRGSGEYPFPPIRVYRGPGGELWPTDGFHRIMAVRMVGLGTIEADVIEGDLLAAKLDSAGANTTNGNRMNHEDKSFNVSRFFTDADLVDKYTAAEIARFCQCSERLVRQVATNLGAREDYIIRRVNGRIQKNPKPTPPPAEQIAEPVREVLRDTHVVDSALEQRRLARLDQKTQAEVATMLAAGDAASVTDAARRIALCDEMDDGDEDDLDYSDVPTDIENRVQRHVRQVQPGQYEVRFNIDELGMGRLLDLLEATGRGELSGCLAVPGKPTADLMRELLREGWERRVRVGIKDTTPQDAIVARVAPASSPSELQAARMVAAMAVALADLSERFYMPRAVAHALEDNREMAKYYIEHEEYWSQGGGARLRKPLGASDVAAAMATVQANLFLMAHNLGIDVVAQALAETR